MNRQIWETLWTALQAWEAVDFNADFESERKREWKLYNEAVDYLLSVEPEGGDW